MLLLRYLIRRNWCLFYLVPELVGHFEVGFATDGGEVGSLEKGALVINVARHGG